MAKSQKTLVDLARSKTPKQSPTQISFIDKLPDEIRQQLLDLREQFLAGNLGNWTPRGLLEEIVEPAGVEIGVSLATFRRWLYEGQRKNKK
jgi:hypothetical protein